MGRRSRQVIAVMVVMAAAALLGLTATTAMPDTPTSPAAAAQVDERFQTGFPHAFVDSASGEAVRLHGVNLRDAMSPNGWHLGRAEVDHIRSAGFNMVRLGLKWRWFEPERGVFDDSAFATLSSLLTELDRAGLHVILDPIHVKGAGHRDGNWFEIPAWVWAQSPAVPSESAATDAMLDRLRAHASPFLEELTRRVAHREEVIAIDLVNEVKTWPPIDRGGPDDGQAHLLDFYDELITNVRVIDPDQIVIIEPVYGNSDPRQTGLDRLQPANRQNLIWSIHDYYTGDAGTGFRTTGRVDGTHVWSGADYPTTPDRATLLAGQRAQLAAHVDWAARWQVPVFIGEFGIDVTAPNGTAFIDDKVALYDEPWAGSTMGLPWAYWVWTYDGRFGLHDTGSHATSPYAGRLTHTTPVDPPPTAATPSPTTTTTAAPAPPPPPPTTSTTTTSPPPTAAPAPTSCVAHGYVLGLANGELRGFGVPVNADPAGGELVDVELTPDGCGAWALDSHGAIRAVGTAAALAYPDVALATDERFVSLSATGSGLGLWLFTDRGRVVTIGDATLHTGAGGLTDLATISLNGPIVDSVAAADGEGYLLLGADGGVFAFGSATFRGSIPGLDVTPAAPATGIAAAAGGGYWIVAADGGAFAFGSTYRGSVPQALGPGVALNAPVVDIVAYGSGYLHVAADGGIFVFSDEPFLGSLGATPLDSPVAAAG